MQIVGGIIYTMDSFVSSKRMGRLVGVTGLFPSIYWEKLSPVLLYL